MATVVVVTGTVVVGVGATVVVVTGCVVVDWFDLGVVVGEAGVEDAVFSAAPWCDDVATCPIMTVLRGGVTGVLRRFEMVVVVFLACAYTAVEEVDTGVRLAVGEIELAMTGIAVTLKRTPAARNPREPTTTNRRGARREARDASPELFCPCVKFNMKQLSETHSKLRSTTAQHLLNLISGVRTLRCGRVHATRSTAQV